MSVLASGQLRLPRLCPPNERLRGYPQWFRPVEAVIVYPTLCAILNVNYYLSTFSSFLSISIDCVIESHNPYELVRAVRDECSSRGAPCGIRVI